MSDLLAILQPNFLLHNALWGGIAVGFFCPLMGVYFMLRRMTLLGVALPQVSAAGIAFTFLLQGLGVSWSLHAGEENDRFLALGGSLVFTLAALLLLAYFNRREERTSESRIGAAYALAYAASLLLVSENPTGKIEMLGMLHGEIVSVTAQDLHLLLTIYTLLTIFLVIFNDQFLLVSFDRESARVMGKQVVAWDMLLYSIIGISISIGVLMVGPMLTFAFIIVPPLAARRFCKRMGSFFLISSLIGGLSGFLGFYLSYRLDWPLGPTDIAVSCALLVLALAIRKALEFKGWKQCRRSA
jgi:ABC-type Mn2+/Zn2+ transport system permease subunit